MTWTVMTRCFPPEQVTAVVLAVPTPRVAFRRVVESLLPFLVVPPSPEPCRQFAAGRCRKEGLAGPAMASLAGLHGMGRLAQLSAIAGESAAHKLLSDEKVESCKASCPPF